MSGCQGKYFECGQSRVGEYSVCNSPIAATRNHKIFAIYFKEIAKITPKYSGKCNMHQLCYEWLPREKNYIGKFC